jgi:hypothetical protein
VAGHRFHLHSWRIPRDSTRVYFVVIGIRVHRDLRNDGLDQLEKVPADNFLHRAAESGREMRNAPILVAVLLCGPWNSLLRAADFSIYRSFQLGMGLTEAAKRADRKNVDARTVYQRPALIQEMNWAPSSSALSGTARQDPVQKCLLRFYNGRLFQIVVSYDHYKVEGMTAEDLIQAISSIYGTPTRPSVEIPYHSLYGETAPVLARWEDSQYSYSLVPSREEASFALILSSKELDTLAETAISQAARLDAEEAPLKEMEKEKKKEDDERTLLEKARSVNKPNFRP